MYETTLRKSDRTLALLTSVIVTLICSSIAAPAFAGCASCQGITGLGVEPKDGTTWALPVASGWELGPGGPGRSSPTRLPIPGGPRNFGTADNPHIRMGDSMVITVDGSGNVLVSGVLRALWSWNSGTRTLVAPGGYTYVFNADGLVTSISGLDGLRTTGYDYDAAYTDRLSGVTDSYGNEWTYEFSTEDYEYGPTSVENPDHTKRVELTYKAGGSSGAGQYDVVTVKKWNGSSWVEDQHTEYSYDSDNRITGISTSVPGYPSETSTTYIEYVDGTEGGLDDPVRRISNQKLQIDICYTYSSIGIPDINSQSQPYGIVTIRRRAECSSSTAYSSGDNNDAADHVTDYYYYRDTTNGPNKYLYKAVRRKSDGGNGLVDYSATQQQVYGYLTRFASGGNLPSDYASEVLKGQPWKVIDSRNKTTTYSYSTENGMVTGVTLPTSDQISYSFLQDGGSDSAFLAQTVDSRDVYTRYTRDSTYNSQVTDIDVSGDSGTTWSTVKQMSYYDNTMPQKAYLLHTVTVPSIGDSSEDMVTTYDYDEIIDSTTYYRPQPTEEEYAWYNGSTYENVTSATSFYADGRVRWDKDALDNQTDYEYDTECRLTRTLSPVDSQDTGTVDSVTSTTIADTGKAWYTDQLKGMMLTIDYGGGTVLDYVITANDEDTITVVGDTSNAQGATYSVRPVSTLAYSTCCGQVEEETDGVGRKTNYQYDDRGRVSEIRNSETGSNSTYPLVKYTYNDLGQKTEVKTYKDSNDSTGRATTYTYDQLGRVIQVTYPTNGGTALLWSEYYQYDESGDLVAKCVGVVNGSGKVAEGKVTAYEYDDLNRIVELDYDYYSGVDIDDRDWPVGSVDSYGDISISSADVSYQYAAGSNLKTQMTDASGTSSYTYDLHGRLETYTPPLPANYRVEYKYNAAGQKTFVTVEYNDSGWADKYQTAYAYFKNGWLKQVKGQKYVSGNWTDVTQVDFEYDATGNVTKRRNNKDAQTPDVVTEYDYNARSEAMTIDHKLSATSQYALDYGRDGVGTPLQISFGGNSFNNAYTNANIVRYGYDDAGRLTGQTWGHDSGVWQQDHADTWSYDWVGNRDPGSNTYNQVDEMSGYQYDMLGNVEFDPDSSSSPRTRYYYNSNNLLSQVDYVNGGTTTTTTMTWDADQQRLKLANGSDTWEMVYDTVAGIPAVLLAANYVNSAASCEYYVRGPGGELLASFVDGETPSPRCYHFDALGSTVLVSNGSGTVSAANTYDAWGATLAGSGTAVPYGYVGELGYYAHTSTQGTTLQDLLQLGVRFYDPEIGRFTQRDALAVRYNEQSSYVYANAAPAGFRDPRGLRSEEVRISCRGLNPARTKNAAEPCQQCCNSLAADASIQNIVAIALEAGVPGPITIADSVIARCQEDCEAECRCYPSGSIAVTNFARCVLPNTVSDYKWGIIVDALIRYLSRVY